MSGVLFLYAKEMRFVDIPFAFWAKCAMIRKTENGGQMMLDFIRIACAVPNVKVGDLIAFPELALTGYTCGDLFFQDTLYNGVKAGVKAVADCSAKYPNLMIAVGLPVRVGTKLYNCAGVFSRGELLCLVPKIHLTAAEKRWFSSGSELETAWLRPEAMGLTASEDYWTIQISADNVFCLGDDAMVGTGGKGRGSNSEPVCLCRNGG